MRATNPSMWPTYIPMDAQENQNNSRFVIVLLDQEYVRLGIGSNKGDKPIDVANIYPHGCIGKSKQLKVCTYVIVLLDQEYVRLGIGSNKGDKPIYQHLCGQHISPWMHRKIKTTQGLCNVFVIVFVRLDQVGLKQVRLGLVLSLVATHLCGLFTSHGCIGNSQHLKDCF